MDNREPASEGARRLNEARWGNRVAVRAAHTMLERVDELPPTLRAEVHLATRDMDDATEEQ